MPEPQLNGYELFSRRFKADPFPTYAAMRRDAPIYAHRAPDGTTNWYITRAEDVVAVLKDNDRFVKDVRRTRPFQPAPAQHASLQRLINENMLFSDPPDHSRLRALVNQAFTPRRIEALADRVQTVADTLAPVIARGSMDLMAAFALPLPVSVIAALLGIPAADQEQVAVWSQAIISPRSRGLTYRLRRQRLRAFVDYLARLIAKRRRHPADDLITGLVQAEESGERLSEAELSSMVALLLVTGHETTVNLIGNSVLALLQHPEQCDLLRQDPALIETAVEELLRYDGPVETSTTRWVRHDLNFQGHNMLRGDIVRVVLASANRDPERFAAADSLDIRRADNKHLAFGLGIHYCLGAPLARMEGQIALTTLLRRLPRLRLSVPVEALTWRTGILFRGLAQLPIAWHYSL
jgi:cytochrome P450